MPIPNARSYYAVLYARPSNPFPGGHLEVRSRRFPTIGALNAWLTGPKSQLPERYQSRTCGSDLPEEIPTQADLTK